MMEFETFVLLQNQKTGSSFLGKFFRRHAQENLLRRRTHSPILDGYDPEKTYICSVRHPVALYVSLFNFGLDGGGNARTRLKRAGRADLYGPTADHFHGWLDVVLDPANGPLLGQDARTTPLLGLLSARFLRLALVGGDAALLGWTAADDVRGAYRERGILDHVLRTEALSADLKALVRGPLAHVVRDSGRAIAWIDRGKRTNSSRPVIGKDAVGAEHRARIMAREWFLAETFYADAPPTAPWDRAGAGAAMG